MIESIIKKTLGKIMLAAIGAILLAAVTIVVTDIAWWTILMMLILVLASFVNTYIELNKSFINGDIVAVYGSCISIEGYENFMGKTQKNTFSYRFVSLADDGESEDAVASFYIKGKKGEFIEGESYCLLFRKKNKEMELSDSNLIGYEIIKTNPVTISTAPNEKNNIKKTEETVEKLVQVQNAIYFTPMSNEEKEDE